MKKTTRYCIIGFSSILILGAVGTATYFLIEGFNKQSKLQAYNVFNDVVSDLSNSEDSFDKTTLDFYKTNTATLYSGDTSSQKGSMGTIWNYPTPTNGDINRQYFATNIHVVSDALVWQDSSKSFSVDKTFAFFLKQKAFGIIHGYWMLK